MSVDEMTRAVALYLRTIELWAADHGA
jgi:hypothetical protein